MIGHFRVHGTNHADIVDGRSYAREDLAYLDPALAALLETERRAHQVARFALSAKISARKRLTIELVKRRLRVERIHLRQAAVQEQKYDVFSTRGKVRFLGTSAIRLQQTAQPHHSEAAAH